MTTGILGNFLQPQNMDNMALAFNSLRMKPDPNLAQFIQNRQGQRLAETNRQKAMEFFQGKPNGAAYIAALGSGGDPSGLIQSYISNQNARATAASGRVDPNKTIELFSKRCDAGDQAACDVVLGAQTGAASLSQLIGIYAQEKATGRKQHQGRFYPGGLEVKQMGDGTTRYYMNGVELTNADDIFKAQQDVQAFEAEGQGEKKSAVLLAEKIEDQKTAIRGVRERLESTAPLIQELINHSGMAGAVGSLAASERGPNTYAKGAPEREFIAKYNQLAGKIFLSAFAGLKGGGQITELEGKKAQEAASSISRTLSASQLQSAMQSYIQSLVSQHQRLFAELQNMETTNTPQRLPQNLLNLFPSNL
jgi:hypothetical protein